MSRARACELRMQAPFQRSTQSCLQQMSLYLSALALVPRYVAPARQLLYSRVRLRPARSSDAPSIAHACVHALPPPPLAVSRLSCCVALPRLYTICSPSLPPFLLPL
eukprot:COSAG02_NODE_15072_length_1207_cov_1.528881_1_plen_106_part_10